MNKIMKYGLLTLVIVGMLSSCNDLKNAKDNNYPAPQIPEPPVGTEYTIRQLLDTISLDGNPDYNNKDIFKDDCSVYGVVTADETSGNLYKTSFIQEIDTATGIPYAIELYMKSVTGLRIGDSVRVCLKGATLGAYKGTPQIQDLNPINVVILENCKSIDPEVATIPELTFPPQVLTNRHICQFVRLENVQFVAADTTKNWAEENDYGERTLEQFVQIDSVTWNKVGEIMVRTSNYAAFGNKPLPTGNGYLSAILTLYKNTWQLVVRDDNARDVLMDGERH